MAKNKNQAQEEIDKIVNERWKEIEKDFDKVLRKVNLEMRDEANKLYDKLIERYYRYKTTSYIRHWEFVPGTRQGTNLYGGKNIVADNKRQPYIIIDPTTFGLEGVEGGYQYDEPYDVVQGVLKGRRGPEPWATNWNATYESMLFRYQRGTMIGAFRKFNYEFDRIAEKLFYPKWDKLYD